MHMRGKTICEFSEAGCIPEIFRDTENTPSTPGVRAGWLSTHDETARTRAQMTLLRPTPPTLLNVWGPIQNLWGLIHFVWSRPYMHGARSTVLYCTARI